MHITHYQPGPLDHNLLAWHNTMLLDPEEFLTTFTAPMQWPSVFLTFFQQPRQLFLDQNAFGTIKQALWVEPSGEVAYLGMWAAPEYRGKKRQVQFFCEVVDAFSQAYRTIVGLLKDRKGTKMQAYLNLHRRLGYEVSGKLPHAFNAEPAYLVFLTREAFLASRVYRVWQRVQEKGVH
jgi:hypothetical protein